MRILVAEDEKHLNRIISEALTDEGYSVDSCFNGQEVLEHMACARYDVLALDIMMPRMDGLEVVRRLRSEGDATPVLFLTSRDSIEDKVTGLESGGDYYLTKPFAFPELLAVVRAMARKYTGNRSNTYTVADLTLDSAAHMVLQRGQPVELTPREFALLEQLMRNRGAAIYRDTLMERAWGGDAETTRAVDTYITRLRKKLNWGDKIETVYQIGYRLKQE